MSFGTRLKETRENKGYKQNQFADMLGITATRLNYWEKDKREPDVEMIKKISALLNVSSDWLIGNEHYIVDTPIFNNIEKDIIEKYRSLDEYGKKAVGGLLNTEYERCTTPTTEQSIIHLPKSILKPSAGTGNWLDEQQLESVSVVDTPVARKANLILEVDGDSMSPMYENGDNVFVRTQTDIEVGDIGIFIVDGNGYIKKLGKDRLISVNPEYDDIYPTEYSDFRCVGKVLGKAEIVE